MDLTPKATGIKAKINKRIVIIFITIKSFCTGVPGAPSVRRQTLDFGSGHDLVICGIESPVSGRPYLRFPLSLSLPLPCSFSFQNHKEIPPHTCQNGEHQQHREQQVLARTRRKGALAHCGWERRPVQPPWRPVWRVLGLEKQRPYHPATALLSSYRKETKSPIPKPTRTPTFTATSRTVGKTRKPRRCPSKDERIKKSGT